MHVYRSRKDAVIPLSQPVRGIDGNYISELPVAEGTTIIVGIRATNLNKELWGEDAREWKPERWMAPLPTAVEEAHIPGVYANQYVIRYKPGFPSFVKT